MTPPTEGDDMKRTDESTMAAALAPFGWTCGPEFWERYYTDAWVFSLANAVERLTEQVTDLQAAEWNARLDR